MPYTTRWGRDSVAACHAERLPVTDWLHPDFARSCAPAREVAPATMAGRRPRIAWRLLDAVGAWWS